MPAEILTIEQALTLLADYPSRIAALTNGLSPAQLRQRPEPEEWSANELLWHLRTCADVWGGYISRILTEDKPNIKAISPRSRMKKTGYEQLEFVPSFEAYTAQRADLIAALKPLTPEGWLHSAMVTKDGKTRELTVLDYATQIANHEQVHIAQFESTLHTVRL
jgi:uncharacterized damage-inducible protein DinB